MRKQRLSLYSLRGEGEREGGREERVRARGEREREIEISENRSLIDLAILIILCSP